MTWPWLVALGTLAFAAIALPGIVASVAESLALAKRGK